MLTHLNVSIHFSSTLEDSFNLVHFIVCTIWETFAYIVFSMIGFLFKTIFGKRVLKLVFFF